MGKTKIVLNRAGVRELMQSTEMQAILVEHASKIARASDAEVYLGWGILVPEWFARIKEA